MLTMHDDEAIARSPKYIYTLPFTQGIQYIPLSRVFFFFYNLNLEYSNKLISFQNIYFNACNILKFRIVPCMPEECKKLCHEIKRAICIGFDNFKRLRYTYIYTYIYSLFSRFSFLIFPSLFLGDERDKQILLLLLLLKRQEDKNTHS